jgi:hypothetical protein
LSADGKLDGIFALFRGHRLSFRIPEASSAANGQFRSVSGQSSPSRDGSRFPPLAECETPVSPCRLPVPSSPTNKVIRLSSVGGRKATKVEKNENKVFKETGKGRRVEPVGVSNRSADRFYSLSAKIPASFANRFDPLPVFEKDPKKPYFGTSKP